MIGSVLTPDTKSSSEGLPQTGCPCDNQAPYRNGASDGSSNWVSRRAPPTPTPKEMRANHSPSLHFNTKEATTLVLGIALGYSSPSAAGKWIETINVVSMGKQDGGAA